MLITERANKPACVLGRALAGPAQLAQRLCLGIYPKEIAPVTVLEPFLSELGSLE